MSQEFAYDGFDFDPDMEFPLDREEQPRGMFSGARRAIGDFAGAAYNSTVSSFTDVDGVKSDLKQKLPKPFKTTIDRYDMTVDTVKDLYDHAKKTIGPDIANLTQTLEDAVPERFTKTRGVLRGVRERIQPTNRSVGNNFEEDSIQGQIAATFQGAVPTTVSDARDDAREIVSQEVEQQRHKETFGQMGQMVGRLDRMVMYNEKVGLPFSKKLLEVNIRSYMTLSKMLREMRDTRMEQSNILKAIGSNTALPDFVKARGSEFMKHELARRATGSLTNKIFGDKSIFKNALGRFSQDAKGYINEKATSLAAKMFPIEQMIGVMGGGSGNMMGLMGAITGSMLGGEARAKLIEKLVARLDDNPELKTKFYDIANATNDPSEIFDKILSSEKFRKMESMGESATDEAEPGKKFENFKNRMAKKGAEGTRTAFEYLSTLFRTAGGDASVETGRGGDSAITPYYYTRRTDNVITYLIPGLLARILQQNTITNNPGKDVGLVGYDPITGRIQDMNVIKQGVTDKLKKEMRDSSMRGDVREFGEYLRSSTEGDEGEKATYTKLAHRILTRHQGGLSGKNLRGSEAYAGLNESERAIMERIISRLDANGLTGSKFKADTYGALEKARENAVSHGSTIQRLIDDGLLEQLEDMGLVKRNSTGSYSLDMRGILDMQESDFTEDDTVASDVNIKTDIRPTTRGESLRKVRKIPISKWRYRKDKRGRVRKGPMAQTVRAVMGEQAAPGGTKIDLVSMNGELMQAVQELADQQDVLNAQMHSGYVPNFTMVGGKAPKQDAWSRTIDQTLLRREPRTQEEFIAGIYRHVKSLDEGFGVGKFTMRIPGFEMGDMGEFLQNVKKMASGVNFRIPGVDDMGAMARPIIQTASPFLNALQSVIQTGIARTINAAVDGTVSVGKGFWKAGTWTKDFVMDKKDGVAGALKRGIGLGAEFLGNAVKTGFNSGVSVLRGAFGISKAAHEGLMGVLNGPRDVFLAGTTSPVLLETRMRKGNYTTLKDGRVIDTVEKLMTANDDIFDSVAGNVALRWEDAEKGLYDIQGNKLRVVREHLAHGAARLAAMGIRKAAGLAQRGLGSVTDIWNSTSKFNLGGVKSFFGNLMPSMSGIGLSDDRQLGLLAQIRDLLAVGKPKKVIRHVYSRDLKDKSHWKGSDFVSMLFGISLEDAAERLLGSKADFIVGSKGDVRDNRAVGGDPIGKSMQAAKKALDEYNKDPSKVHGKIQGAFSWLKGRLNPFKGSGSGTSPGFFRRTVDRLNPFNWFKKKPSGTDLTVYNPGYDAPTYGEVVDGPGDGGAKPSRFSKDRSNVTDVIAKGDPATNVRAIMALSDQRNEKNMDKVVNAIKESIKSLPAPVVKVDGDNDGGGALTTAGSPAGGGDVAPVSTGRWGKIKGALSKIPGAGLARKAFGLLPVGKIGSLASLAGSAAGFLGRGVGGLLNMFGKTSERAAVNGGQSAIEMSQGPIYDPIRRDKSADRLGGGYDLAVRAQEEDKQRRQLLKEKVAASRQDAQQDSFRYKTENVIDKLLANAGGLLSSLGTAASTVFGAISSFASIGGLKKLITGAFGKGKALLTGAGRGIAAGWRAAKGLSTIARGSATLNAVKNGLTAVRVAGLATGSVAGTLAAGASAAGSAVLAVATSPAFLAAAGVSAVGYLGYKAYKYFTRNSLNNLELMRALQYGSDEQSKNLHKYMELEGYLLDGRLSYTAGEVTVNMKRVEPKKLLDIFDIDKEDVDRAGKFLNWYNGRFLPFFIRHAQALYDADPKAKLSDVDKLKYEPFIKYLEKAKYFDGPYDVDASPFADQDRSVNTLPEVKKLVTTLQESKEKDSKVKIKDILIDPVTASQKLAREKQIEEEKRRREAEIARLNAGDLRPPAGTTASALDKTNSALKDQIPNSERGDDLNKPTGPSADTANKGESPTVVPNMASGPMMPSSEGMNFIVLGKGVNLQGLQASVHNNLLSMAAEYGKLTGKKIQVNDAKRSTEEQARLYRTMPGKAARPGSSMHEHGLAFDINSENANELEKLGLMRKYGFTRPVGGELWHVEPAGVQINLDRAKKDPAWAAQQVLLSPGRGGGGYAMESGAVMKRRNNAMAAAAFESSAQNPVSNSEVSALKAAGGLGGAHGAAANDPSFKSNMPIVGGGTTASLGGSGNGTTSAGGPPPMPGGGEAGALKKAGSGGANLSENTQKVMNDIREGTRRAGGDAKDENNMLLFAAAESSMGKKTVGSGKARGTMQFMPTTWAEQNAKYGAKYGGNLDINNTKDSTTLAKEYRDSNRKQLKGVEGEMDIFHDYLAHFFGPSGANRFLALSDDTMVAPKFPGPASQAGNFSMFYHKGGKAKTKAEFRNDVYLKFDKLAKEYGLESPLDKKGGTAVASAPGTSGPATSAPSSGNSPVTPPSGPMAGGGGGAGGMQDALYRPSGDPTQSNLVTQTRATQNVDRKAFNDAKVDTTVTELSRLRPPDTSVRSSELLVSGIAPLFANADAQRAKIVDSLERDIVPGLKNIGDVLERIYKAVANGEDGGKAANSPSNPGAKSKTVTATESVVDRKRSFG